MIYIYTKYISTDVRCNTNKLAESLQNLLRWSFLPWPFFPKKFQKSSVCSPWLFCLRTFNDPQTLYLLFEAALGGGGSVKKLPRDAVQVGWKNGCLLRIPTGVPPTFYGEVWFGDFLLLLGNSYYVLREMMIDGQLELLAVSEERWFAWLVPTEEIVWKREACCVLWSRRPTDTSLTFAHSLRQLTQSLKKREREREIEETSVLGLHLEAKQQQ